MATNDNDEYKQEKGPLPEVVFTSETGELESDLNLTSEEDETVSKE